MQTETLDSDAPTASRNHSIAALATIGGVWKERAQLKNARKNGIKP